MTFEFKTAVLPNGQIAVPSEIAAQIPVGTQLQVVLTCEAAAAAAAAASSSYRALGSKLQEAAYAREETVYDSLA
jgi:hypothetical protein